MGAAERVKENENIENQRKNLPVEFEVRIHSLKPLETVKGIASININGAFAVKGVKIIEGSNGLFVAMPSSKVGNEYRDICFPITPECREQLNKAVLNAYDQALVQGQDMMMKHRGMQQAPVGRDIDMAGM